MVTPPPQTYLFIPHSRRSLGICLHVKLSTYTCIYEQNYDTYLYIYIYIHIYIYIYIYIHIHIYIYMSIQMYKCMCRCLPHLLHMNVVLSLIGYSIGWSIIEPINGLINRLMNWSNTIYIWYIHLYIHIVVNINIYIYLYKCIYTYMYIYIYIYTYTYTYGCPRD